MANNPYAPPRAELAEPAGTRAVGKAVYVSVSVGVLSGITAGVVPWMYGKPGESFSHHSVPLIVGILTAITHAFTLVRLRRQLRGSRSVLLLIANVLVLSTFVAMIVYLININGSQPLLPWIATTFTLFWVVPPALNMIYLVRAAREEGTGEPR